MKFLLSLFYSDPQGVILYLALILFIWIYILSKFFILLTGE